MTCRCLNLATAHATGRTQLNLEPRHELDADSLNTLLKEALFNGGINTLSECCQRQVLRIDAADRSSTRRPCEIPASRALSETEASKNEVSIGGVVAGQSCPTASTECIGLRLAKPVSAGHLPCFDQGLTLQRHGETMWIQIPSWRLECSSVHHS